MQISSKRIVLTVRVVHIAAVTGAAAQFLLGNAIGLAWRSEGGHHYMLVQRRLIESSASLYNFSLWHVRVTIALLAVSVLGAVVQWLLVDRFKEKGAPSEQPAEEEPQSFRMALARLGTPQRSVAATTEINETIDDRPVHDHFVIDDRRFVFHGRHLHVSAGAPAPHMAERKFVDA